MGFYGILWDSSDAEWILQGILWDSMGFLRILWISTEIFGIYKIYFEDF